MKHLSLCSGIGGLDLAAEWAGFETAAQCEIDEYASKVLAKNFPGVPTCDSGWWEAEPDVGRMVDGIPHWVDRLRCLGNAVVPQQAYPIFEAIAEYEQGERKDD